MTPYNLTSVCLHTAHQKKEIYLLRDYRPTLASKLPLYVCTCLASYPQRTSHVVFIVGDWPKILQFVGSYIWGWRYRYIQAYASPTKKPVRGSSFDPCAFQGPNVSVQYSHANTTTAGTLRQLYISVPTKSLRRTQTMMEQDRLVDTYHTWYNAYQYVSTI